MPLLYGWSLLLCKVYKQRYLVLPSDSFTQEYVKPFCDGSFIDLDPMHGVTVRSRLRSCRSIARWPWSLSITSQAKRIIPTGSLLVTENIPWVSLVSRSGSDVDVSVLQRIIVWMGSKGTKACSRFTCFTSFTKLSLRALKWSIPHSSNAVGKCSRMLLKFWEFTAHGTKLLKTSMRATGNQFFATISLLDSKSTTI